MEKWRDVFSIQIAMNRLLEIPNGAIMKNTTLLVVEDNAMNMKLIRCILSIPRYRVIEAQDAETGVELARRHQPDLILMDIKLPGMDGLTATRIIRSDPQLKKIPIVAVTSHAMSGDADRATKAGCNDYMTKPIRPRKLLDTVGKWLKPAGRKIASSKESSACELRTV